MIQESPVLQQLIRQLQQVPYLASKNLYRVAHHFLEMDTQKATHFLQAVQAAQAHLEKCSVCFIWKERERDCPFCASQKRDHAIVCVVEQWYDVQAIEKTSSYNGMYHVLGGVIYPLEGIGPDQLTIKQLKERVAQGEIKEVILALNQTPEGEATAAYISRVLQGHPVLLTCLARGVPVGGTLEYIDRITVQKALKERRPF